MKRSNQKSMKYCKVCRGEWNPLKFKNIQKKFDHLKKERLRDSQQPLGEKQVQYLLQHFFDDDGLHKALCHKHLREFAAISNYKVSHLKELPGDALTLRNPSSTLPHSDSIGLLIVSCHHRLTSTFWTSWSPTASPFPMNRAFF